MKRHLKRLNAPKSWTIRRKEFVFTVKPRPGTHKKGFALPLTIVLRDVIGVARTTREVKQLLWKKEVLVDGKRRTTGTFLVGLMDVLSIPDSKLFFRSFINKKGAVVFQKIEEKESTCKLCKITKKHLISDGKIQLTLHDGRNIIVQSNEYQTNGTLMLELPAGAIIDYVKFDKKAAVYMTGGKHIGEIGHIESFEGNNITIKTKEGGFETLKDYAFVIGKDTPLISMK